MSWDQKPPWTSYAIREPTISFEFDHESMCEDVNGLE